MADRPYPEPPLDRCPFCKSGNVNLATLAGKFCVQCAECEASGPWVDKPSLAIEAWNRRAAPAPGGEVVIDAYAIASPNSVVNEVRIQRSRQIHGPALWKVVNGTGGVLNKAGEWEYEPMPSSRDDAFLARCRFATAEEGIRAAIADAERAKP